MCVCTRAEREVVLSNLDTLCSVALGEKVTEDFLLARDAVITICSITDHVRVRLYKAYLFKGFLDYGYESQEIKLLPIYRYNFVNLIFTNY